MSFLQTIHKVVLESSGKRAAGKFRKAARGLLNSGPVLGPSLNAVTGGIVGTLFQGTTSALKKIFPDETVEDLYARTERNLADARKRFVIVIDDIDRLDPDEALQVFRLLKSFGRLPNVTYLLAFDRTLAEKAVQARHPSEGPHFLEKIVQATFDLPAPSKQDLLEHVKEGIDSLQGPVLSTNEIRETMNLFYEWVQPNINYPRDVGRYLGALEVTWGAVRGEVCFGDFMALEAFRVFWPDVYRLLQRSRARLVGVRGSGEADEDASGVIDGARKLVSAPLADAVDATLRRLFPRLDSMGYGSDWLEIWERERRACTDRHFDTYFRFSVSPDAVSRSELEHLVASSADRSEFRALLIAAAAARTRGKTSRIPVILDELNTHAASIPPGNVESVISAVFSVADDIDVPSDDAKGFSFARTSLRLHWFVRSLMRDRFSLPERSAIYMAALPYAQVGWACDFTMTAIHDHFPPRGGAPEPKDNCLLEVEVLDEAKAITLETIRAFAAKPEATHRHLGRILFVWKELQSDSSEVRAWTKQKLQTAEGVGELTEAFTSESWSQGLGMFGLGDHVAVRSYRASYEGLEEVLDVELLKERVASLSAEELPEPTRTRIANFVEGLKGRDQGA